MDDQELKELREWSAEVMGWKKEMAPYWPYRRADGSWAGYNEYADQYNRNKWTPDTDLNQCFLVVERMRELGWKIVMGNTFDKSYFAEFRAITYPVPMDNHYAEHDNPCHAILLAARATEVM